MVLKPKKSPSQGLKRIKMRLAIA